MKGKDRRGAKMKSAVVYCRVSTQGQAIEGVSMDAQLNRARAWAAAAGFAVIAEHQDAGISGKRADNRPGLQAAISQACDIKAALVVYSLSRLARSTSDCIAIANRLEASGADLVSLSENLDTTSAAGKMVFRMLAVLAEFERDLISERTKTALDYKRGQGYKTGGTCPFGYTVDANGLLVEEPNEQAAIKLIMNLREQGATLQAICAELERRNIKTKTGGEKWQPKTVSNLLKKPAITGQNQAA